jgi:hypothetical protein
MTWEYIAGFFDGEGSISHHGKGYRITIPQTNFEVLEEIRKFIGVGYIIQPKKRKAHWKDSWIYYIAKQKDVEFFLKKTKSFLIVKRELSSLAEKIVSEFARGQETKKLNRNKKMILAKKLRDEGLTYREIGKRVNTDFGQVRRLILFNGGRSSIG